jgi:hypothetical protein
MDSSSRQDDTFRRSLDEAALDEKWREISSDEAVREGMEDMPRTDLPQMECQVVAAGGGLLSGADFWCKVASFVLNQISSWEHTGR